MAPQQSTDLSGWLDTDLGWSLGVVFRSYVRAAHQLLGDVPGGPRGYQVLAASAQGLPGGQGALAQRLGIDKTVMTYLVDDLEAACLVERHADPADRRNKRVVATEAGDRCLRETRRRLEQVEDHVLGALDPADRVVLRDLLRRLAVTAQAADPVRDTCELVDELAPDA
jgi:DNA-binding MarR family transcriptional regulator